MRQGRNAAAAFAVASVWLAVGNAHGDEPHPRLGLEVTPAGQSCVSERALARQVTDRLGYDPFDATAAVVLRVRITSDQDGASAVLSWRGADQIGERILQTSTCDQLLHSLRAVVVIAATAPPKPAAHPKSARVPVPGEAEVPPPPVARHVGPTVHSAPARAWGHVHALAGIGASADGMADAIPELFVGAVIASRRRSMGLEFHFAARDEVRVEGGGSVVAALRAFTLTPCQRVNRIYLCALLSAGWRLGEGRDLGASRVTRTPHAALGGRVALEHAIGGQLSARLHLDATGNLTRTRLFASDEAVWESPRTEASLGISLIKRVW